MCSDSFLNVLMITLSNQSHTKLNQLKITTETQMLIGQTYVRIFASTSWFCICSDQDQS